MTTLLVPVLLASLASADSFMNDSVADPFADGLTLGAPYAVVAEHWRGLGAAVTINTHDDRATLVIDNENGRIVYLYSGESLLRAWLRRDPTDAAAFNAAVDHWWTRLSELYGAHRYLGGLAALFWEAGPWRAALFYDLSGARPDSVGSVTVSLELQ
ncbi:MAG: hypothetical protein GF403_07815 [Candidatus Coatesbacteria bacterium]|nr:hypothetical protein [Candidatus Coatesbacteria bacterium]